MEKPRYLARQAGHYHSEQYTENPAIGLPREPEAIDKEAQHRFSDESRPALLPREQERLVGLQQGTDARRVTAMLAAELDALPA